MLSSTGVGDYTLGWFSSCGPFPTSPPILSTASGADPVVSVLEVEHEWEGGSLWKGEVCPPQPAEAMFRSHKASLSAMMVHGEALCYFMGD